MVESTNGNPKRVMIIVAHPDDGEFMAAGTLAKWARQGSEVYYVLCTSGDKGTSDPEIKPEDLAVIREKEQRAAAAVVGAKDVVFLRYPDGTLQNTLELRKDLVRQIRRYKPDVLVCQDPENRYSDGYINHQIIGPREIPPWTLSSPRLVITMYSRNSLLRKASCHTKSWRYTWAPKAPPLRSGWT